MRFATLLLLLLAVDGNAAGVDAGDGLPTIVAKVQLSAMPAALSVGQAGPLNRFAFDLRQFQAGDPAARVACLYAGGLAYRCDASFSAPETGSDRLRVTLTIPDLGRGKRVVVRFANARGQRDVAVDLVNVSQVVHEIEAVPLPGGGQAAVGGDGAPRPLMQLVSHSATTTPAMAASTLGAPVSCDQVYAEWVGASGTDPVFASRFGSLNGSIVMSRPVAPGSRVQPGNLPEWLITYPLSATLAQFIAHYEVIYRIGLCPQKIIAG